MIDKDNKQKNFEDLIFNNGLPINSIVAANRMIEILQENNTNCLVSIKDDPKIKRLIWFLNQQIFGQLANIDMHDEWNKLYKEYKQNK